MGLTGLAGNGGIPASGDINGNTPIKIKSGSLTFTSVGASGGQQSQTLVYTTPFDANTSDFAFSLNGSQATTAEADFAVTANSASQMTVQCTNHAASILTYIIRVVAFGF